MSLLSQKTIARKISISGIGIHTGYKADVEILPSSPNSGIIFKRIDVKKNNIVIPNFANVSDVTLCTTISNHFGIKVSTVEHLMAAFYGLGIDNAIVELNSQEVPILDGSAKEFVKLIKEAGIKVSDVPIKLIKINKKVEVCEGDRFVYNKLLNQNGLRNDLEFVNHKILDCMGDLYLTGYRMVGSLVCSQGGHSLTNKLLRKIFSDKKNYSLLEIKGKNLPHSFANKRQYLKSIA